MRVCVCVCATGVGESDFFTSDMIKQCMLKITPVALEETAARPDHIPITSKITSPIAPPIYI